ncbi:phage GP46 family protein [Humitalea sp. 24SJ18S-53]|uniref:phage GP46 family protein n=1 Tax=Humitalea sp. 24SJ18S-53 TaxID=3422307 RepID=UPI003D67A9D5
MAALLDLAIRRDPDTGQFGLAIEGRDLAWDRTAATPMIIGLGTDRWAKPDDILPDGTRAAEATEVGARRGWPGDAVLGGRIGCRLWLLAREKQRETTRLRAIAYAEEGLASLRDRGFDVSVEATWLRRGLLSLTARSGTSTLTIQRQVAA